MDSIPNNEASASTKRKACLNSVRKPKKAVKVIGISPPESQKQSLNGILRGTKASKSLTFGCIDCRVSGECTCPHSNMTESSILTQTSFEDELQSHLSSLAHPPRPRSSKRISWDPEIIPKERTQKQISSYTSLCIDIEQEQWWEDPLLLKACESFLTTSDGKLLDALMGLTPMDVLNIVMQVPVQIKTMILAISRKFAESQEMHRMREWGRLTRRIEGDEEFTNADADNETEVEEDDADDQEEMNRKLAAEKIAHRRVLLEYLDSRLDDYMFCRYQGTLQHPTVCPKAALCSQGIGVVDQASKVYGPTSYIVSLASCRNRPLLSPIRFSQVYMAMKLYRLGKDYKIWIRSIKDIAGYYANMTNHFMASESWITGDRLLVRTQSWIYAHNLEPESKAYVQSFLNGDHLPAYENNLLTSWACRHLISSPSKHIFDFDNPEESAKIRQCEECALEYRIDVVKSIPVNWTHASSHTIGDAFCAVVTVYRDFGRCLTPYDPRWAAHFVEYEFSGFTDDFPAENQKLRNSAEEECTTDWELGGIMKTFEGTDEIVATEFSLHESVLKNMLSTEESRKREVEEKRKMELEKQRRKKEELERQLKEEEQKEKSLRKRFKDKLLTRKNKKELARAAD